MLIADDLKPYLLHEDPPVRDAVIDYFADGWSQDPGLVPTVLQASERYGEAESLARPLRLSSLHADE